MKYSIFLCSCLLAVASPTFGLQCYTTDVEKASKGVIEERKTECGTQIDEIRRIMGPHVGSTIPDVSFRCFTVTVKGSKSVNVKGCIVNGGCSKLKEQYKSLGGTGTVSVECDECKGDNCNDKPSGAGRGAVVAMAAVVFAAAAFVF